MLNTDYRDMLEALLDENAHFLVVGAYGMSAYGYTRATIDIDIWVNPAPDNAAAVLRALQRFGAPLEGVTVQDLQKDDLVLQIGVAPRRIDIITSASGLRFDHAYAHCKRVEMDGLEVRVPSLEDLVRNKRASGRTKDLADAEALEGLAEKERHRGHR